MTNQDPYVWIDPFEEIEKARQEGYNAGREACEDERCEDGCEAAIYASIES